MNMNGKGGRINPTEFGQAKCSKIQGDPETTDSKIKDVWFQEKVAYFIL